MKVVSVAQMRALEARAEQAGLPGPALMELAGRAVADAIAIFLEPVRGRRIVILVGPGNNGGDGLVAARWLATLGARISVLSVNRRGEGDARDYLLGDHGVPIFPFDESWSDKSIAAALSGSDLILDALLGIGQRRPIGGAMQALLSAARHCGAPIVGLDLPSGADGDTGEVDEMTPRCIATLSLGAVKQGLLHGEASARAGRLVPLDISIPSTLGGDVEVEVLDGAVTRSLLPRREVLGHKGTFGRVLVVAGSTQYLGAPILTAVGAARAGAGLVTLATSGSVSAAAAAVPEITHLQLPGPVEHISHAAIEVLVEAAARYDAIVVGPGLGRHEQTSRFLSELLASDAIRTGPRVVLDADALTLLSSFQNWPSRLPQNAVLTPHPLEMARLLGVGEPPMRRLEIAQDSARAWRTNLVLKGAYTVVATTAGVAVSLSANPALSTAGTGDVLAGVIAGLIAQGATSPEAARAGVAVHAAAGEIVWAKTGEAGALASDIAGKIPHALQFIRSGGDPWGLSASSGLLSTR